MAYSRKAINFDLSTADLKKYFKNTAEAYSQIKNFMLQNGFEHRQYSGYVTCTQKFDVTDVDKHHDLINILVDTAQRQLQQQMQYSKDTLKQKKFHSTQNQIPTTHKSKNKKK